jgi:hypothetical protein
MSRIVLTFLLALVLAQAAVATVLHVPADYPTIQAGINAASEGDTVLLMDGTFSGPGNQGIAFFGKAITVCSQSGDPSTCIVDVGWDYESGFVFLHGEGPNSVLASVTITHAYSGVKCRSGASPSIINCVFVDNMNSNGGGIACTSSASPTITDCVFTANVATNDNLGGGGGVSCYGGCAPTVTNCIFTGNSAPGGYGGGGGIFTRSSPFPTIVGCTFQDNWAGTGGAIMAFDVSTAPASTLSNCVFFGNSSVKWGGVLMLGETEPLAVTSCTFVENYAAGGNLSSSGGAVYMSSASTAVFSDCLFKDNSAGYQGGAAATQGGASLHFEDSTFRENEASIGGAVLISGAVCSLTGCSLEGNVANFGGTGYFTTDSEVSLDRCTVAGSAASTGGGFYCSSSVVSFSNTIIAFGTEGSAISGIATLACCDIYGNVGGDWTYPFSDQLGMNGNICENPLFCGDQSPDTPYTLHIDSPCAPESNPACGPIGAWGVGCGSTPASDRSWGGIKAMFR